MEINDQFNPHLAEALKPSGYNVLNSIAKVVHSFADEKEKKQERQEAIDYQKGVDSFNQNIKERDMSLKERKQYWTEDSSEEEFDWKKSNDLFNQNMKKEEFGWKKDTDKFNQKIKIGDQKLRERSTNANISNMAYNQKLNRDKFDWKKSNDVFSQKAKEKELSLKERQISTEAKKIYRENVSSLPREERANYQKENPFIEFRKNYEESTYMNKGKHSSTEAKKAYRENLLSLPREERANYRKENPFIEFRDNYNEAKKMNGGVSSAKTINKNIANFSKKHNIENFSNYDFYNGLYKGDVSPDEVAELQRIMANSKQASVLDSQMSKKAGAMGEVAGQARRFGTYADSKNVDTNMFKAVVDEVETYIPGLEYSESEIENEEFRRDFLNITATLLKLQSGLTVTDKEAQRFEQSMGSFDRNKNANFIGIKQKLEDMKANFEGVRTIDPQYFNIKYGASIRGLDRSISIIDEAINRKKETAAEIKEEDSPVGYSLKMNPFKLF